MTKETLDRPFDSAETNSSNIEAHYYFKLKHDIQNDSELPLAKEEIEGLMGISPESIENFVDVLCRDPLNDFVSFKGFRVQDIITRQPYCGVLQGYQVKTEIRNCSNLMSRLAYFRDFFVLMTSDKIEEVRILHPILDKIESLSFRDETSTYDLSPFIQLFTIKKTYPKILVRFIPMHVLYEPSNYVTRLARKVSQADRMFENSIAHFRENFKRPFSPASSRWFKTIEDFIDARDAPQLYLTHYIGVKGKFFPRMAKAIMNSIKLTKGELLLDPFCGSGTMNLEAVLNGINTIGVDMQPLFTEITRIKILSLSWDAEWLRKEIEHLIKDIHYSMDSLTKKESLSKFLSLPKIAEISLPNSRMRGVREDSLNCIRVIKGCIKNLKNKDVQRFCEMALAYWIRSMLKKQNPQKIIQTFSDRLWSMFFSVYYFWRFQREINNIELAEARICTGDIRDLGNVIAKGLEYFGREDVDAIVTSPPYGTAIDYIGEHVYALYVLDLIEDHLDLDKIHIGSPRVNSTLVRNITNRSEEFLSLPDSAQLILLKMVKSGRSSKATAFYKYFVDMYESFKKMFDVLASNKFLVMVIGKQQTVKLDDETGVIELGKIMEDIGKSVGLKHMKSIDVGLRKASMRGAIPTEHIIYFQKSS